MATNPVINGNVFSWASVEVGVDGVDTPDFTEVNYKASQDIGKARGTGTRVKGTTAGESDGEGSFSMLKGQASKFIKQLGHGFLKKKRISLTVNYQDDGEDEIITDELISCRITNVEDNPKQGTEPLTTKFDIHILRMKLAGIDPHGDEEGTDE